MKISREGGEKVCLRHLSKIFVKDLQSFDREYFFKNFRTNIRAFEDFLFGVAPIIQKSSLQRSTATPAERLYCTDWIILILPKHQKTIDHKTIFFFFIGVPIVRAAAEFLLLPFSCCCC